MKITDVRLFSVAGEGPPEFRRYEARQAQPLDAYGPPDVPDDAPPVEPTEPVAITHHYVEVVTDDGPAGLFGPIMIEQAALIARLLRPRLLGEDPLAGELLWDRLVRADRHGRAGHYMMAVSAVDCALWDLRGKRFGVPVYRLLGGPTRDAIPAYASMLGHSLAPDLVRRRAGEALANGLAVQKWFFRWGPAHGAEGRRRNVELVRTLRDELDDAVELMFDCFMGWDLPYAVDMARSIVPFRPKWLEEPLPAGHVEGFARLRRETGVPLAAGEHLYTRWDVKPYLDAGALDYVQADPDWTGGITELVRICALAAAYDVQVVPHGHGAAAAAHVIAAQPPWLCPMQEYLLLHLPRHQFFHKSPLVPVDGRIPLPAGPGLGIEIDEGKVEQRSELDFG